MALRYLRGCQFLMLALCATLAGCGSKAQPTEKEDEWLPLVTWVRLHDGSLAWSDESEMGLHAERCWKDGNSFRCIQLLRTDPAANDGISVDIDDGYATFYSRETAKLQPYKVYPEHGYSCRTLPDAGLAMTNTIAKESITLSNGASVSNSIVGGMGEDSGWSAKYIREFVATNAPSDPKVVPFNCVSLVAFLERANDKAFLTTALKEADAFD